MAMTHQAAATAPAGDSVVRGGGGGDLRRDDLFRKRVADRGGDGLQIDDAGEPGEGAEQSGVGQSAADILSASSEAGTVST